MLSVYAVGLHQRHAGQTDGQTHGRTVIILW